jgi:rubrerythrin
MAMYVCRGCGTEIGNKGAFKKCPVCGIKWG